MNIVNCYRSSGVRSDNKSKKNYFILFCLYFKKYVYTWKYVYVVESLRPNQEHNQI